MPTSESVQRTHTLQKRQHLTCSSPRYESLATPLLSGFPIRLPVIVALCCWIHMWERICECDKCCSAVLTRDSTLETGKLFLHRLVKVGTFPMKHFDLVNCHFQWKTILLISFFPDNWSCCFSGATNRRNQVFYMEDVFLPSCGFYWSLKSFLCKTKLILQGNTRQSRKHSPLWISNLPLDLYKISLVSPLSREILVLVVRSRLENKYEDHPSFPSESSANTTKLPLLLLGERHIICNTACNPASTSMNNLKTICLGFLNQLPLHSFLKFPALIMPLDRYNQ